MKKIAIIQSSYIPWKGYFDIIHDVDCFVFLDDVQYTNRDWRSRNKIKANAGEHWLTIPLGNHRNQLIHEVRFKDLAWRDDHLRTIAQFYRKTDHFDKYFELIKEIYYQQEWSFLSDFNQNFIKRISIEILDLKTTFIRSSDIKVEEKKQSKILGLLETLHGDYYVSGPLAKAYIDEKEFKARSIELHYKDYSGYPEYKQLYPPFSHYVSILDLLFNVGADSSHYIWQWREKIS